MDLKEELRTYCEVPAIAHFCSLFRMVFKFSEFDIETLEESFLNTVSGPQARSSLLLDTLICLLKGISGRREVSVDNYNRYFHRVLLNNWELAGLGPNPLGPDAARADFSRLPLYVKVKLVYTLCELRLQKNDVETALRDFTGDSMRVIPLGEDRNGVTYWYFYGTRLYAEDPEIKITIPLKRRLKKRELSESPENKRNTSNDRNTSRVLRSHKKRRKAVSRDYWAKKKRKKLTAKQKPVADEPDKSEPGSDSGEDETGSESHGPTGGLQACKDGVKENGQNSFDQPKPSISVVPKAVNQADEVQDEATLTPTAPDSIPAVQTDDSKSGAGAMLSTVAESGRKGDVKEDRSEAITKRELYTYETAPWLEQPLLKPPTRRRWRVRCDKLEDWNELIDSLKSSTLTKEKHLHDLLANSFLPEIEKFYVQREQERHQREAEMIRRINERLETKRSLRERPLRQVTSLMYREFISSGEEGDHDSVVSDERKRQQEVESREQRYQSRVIEKEKQERLRERAREERARRLMARQERQSSDANVPLDPDSLSDDRALSELDIQLELEFMYGQLEKLIFALKENSDAWPFLEPVTEDIAPGYFEVIKNPMDLSLIETKLMSRQYKNRLEFVEDVNTMLLNCLEYNGLRNDYTKVAQRLERSFIRLWKRYFPASQSNEEDTSLDCVALLGGLDNKIKEKVRAEILMSRPVLTPQVPLSRRPPWQRNSYSATIADTGASPTTRITNNTSFHHRIIRDIVRPISISPNAGSVVNPTYRPIAPRHMWQGSMFSPTSRPVVVRASPNAEGQIRRPPPALNQCGYIITAKNEHRIVRLTLPNGATPPESTIRLIVQWLRDHVDLLSRTVTSVIVYDSAAPEDAKPVDSQPHAYRTYSISDTISIGLPSTDRILAARTTGNPGEPPRLMPVGTVSSTPNQKSVVFVQSSLGPSRQSGPPVLSAAVTASSIDSGSVGCPSATTRVMQKVVTSKPICSVAPLRSISDDAALHPPQLMPANQQSTSTTAVANSNSTPLTLCDQTIVVLSAKQVIVGDSGCYIVNNGRGTAGGGSSGNASHPAGFVSVENAYRSGSSSSDSPSTVTTQGGVQIIQVVPAGVMIGNSSASSSSESTSTTTTTTTTEATSTNSSATNSSSI